MIPTIDFYHVLGAVVAVAVLYLLAKGLIRLWFHEKRKHLDRVLKQINEEK